MKRILSIIISMLSLSTFGQIATYRTSDISKTLDKYGIDSVSVLFEHWSNIPINYIDFNLSKKIAVHITSTNSRHFKILLNVANEYSDTIIANQLYKVISQYLENTRKETEEKKYTEIEELKGDYLYVLAKQYDTIEIENLFFKEYEFWSKLIDKTKKQANFNCHFNCMLLQQGLKLIKSTKYLKETEDFHNQNVDEWRKKYNIYYSSYSYESIDIDLAKEYKDLSEIKFEEEPILFEYIKNRPNDENCWKILIFNGKKGLLNMGCYWAPLMGQGLHLMLELIDNNKMKITTLGWWKS